MQRVLVVQRDGMGAAKVSAIAERNADIEIRTVDVKGPFPPIVDYPEVHFPKDFDDSIAWAELVVDHLYHADLTGFLLEKCTAAGKPLIASGRKVPGAVCPTTCCTLPQLDKFGEYGRLFGMPEVSVSLNADGTVEEVEVLRGAPCGATWRAVKALKGLSAEDAVARFGLETQFNCYAKANANFYLKNPLHVAGEVHAAAMEKAIAAAGK